MAPKVSTIGYVDAQFVSPGMFLDGCSKPVAKLWTPLCCPGMVHIDFTNGPTWCLAKTAKVLVVNR